MPLGPEVAGRQYEEFTRMAFHSESDVGSWYPVEILGVFPGLIWFHGPSPPVSGMDEVDEMWRSLPETQEGAV